ncbi:hypothetical protein GQ457_09G005630 [Hibiscus cannabinus]
MDDARESLLDASIWLQRECLAALGPLQRPFFLSGTTHGRSGVDRSLVRWRRPPVGWTKLNCDGAVVPSSGFSSCGGVIRNEFGGWLIGFSRKLGICSVIEAELWGIYEGLLVAWSLGLNRIIVEVDSADVINLIHQYKVGEASLALVPHIVSLIRRSWTIELSHVSREGNRLADCMAKFPYWNDLLRHRFLSPPDSMVPMIETESQDSLLEGG